MKYRLIVSLFSFCFVLAISAQCSLLDKYSDKKGVEYVYISKAMMKMIGGAVLPENLFAGEGMFVDSNVFGKINCIQIVSCDDDKCLAEMKKDVERFIKESTKEGYEVLLKTKDDEDVTTILVKETGKENFNEYLLISVESDECSFIYISGSLSQIDIQKYAKGASGD